MNAGEGKRLEPAAAPAQGNTIIQSNNPGPRHEGSPETSGSPRLAAFIKPAPEIANYICVGFFCQKKIARPLLMRLAASRDLDTHQIYLTM
jgi:hypothetical protein